MSILSTNSRLIKVGQDYSAGDNISIYEQGEQLYISSKDWTNDIANASANAYNEAVAKIPDPFDPTFISAFVPQSAFDELKQSYDALSSLFATYSGQWLLPNEGV